MEHTLEKCDCWYHRYHCVHVIEGDNRVYDHSQGTWNSTLRYVEPEMVKTFPSELYDHGMSAQELIAKAKEGER
jgi:hypothetical protein